MKKVTNKLILLYQLLFLYPDYKKEKKKKSSASNTILKPIWLFLQTMTINYYEFLLQLWEACNKPNDSGKSYITFIFCDMKKSYLLLGCFTQSLFNLWCMTMIANTHLSWKYYFFLSFPFLRYVWWRWY